MIKYKQGDLFKYISNDEKSKIICHIVNDVGCWGSGFVVPLGRYFPKSKLEYLSSVEKSKKVNLPLLGYCQIVDCSMKTYVANMCAQTGIMSHSTGDRAKVNNKPIRYTALVDCMRYVADFVELNDCEIHCPRFGSDRAGGNWEFIEELIEEIWGDFEVRIYHL